MSDYNLHFTLDGKTNDAVISVSSAVSKLGANMLDLSKISSPHISIARLPEGFKPATGVLRSRDPANLRLSVGAPFLSRVNWKYVLLPVLCGADANLAEIYDEEWVESSFGVRPTSMRLHEPHISVGYFEHAPRGVDEALASFGCFEIGLSGFEVSEGVLYGGVGRSLWSWVFPDGGRS